MTEKDITITIPPEALEAAARAAYTNWVHDCLCSDPTVSIGDYETWASLEDDERDKYVAQARAAILAALKAWPGVQTGSDDGGMTLSGVYLPLNTEKPDE